jgi:hypothetical protein
MEYDWTFSCYVEKNIEQKRPFIKMSKSTGYAKMNEIQESFGGQGKFSLFTKNTRSEQKIFVAFILAHTVHHIR